MLVNILGGMHIKNLLKAVMIMSNTNDYLTNVRDYLNAVFLLKSMQKLGILDKKEYLIAEKLLAKKHCIKTSSIYRLYGLNT